MRSAVLLAFFLSFFVWNVYGATTYNWGGAYVSYGEFNCSTYNEVTAFQAGQCSPSGFLNYRLYECENGKLTVWNCVDDTCNTLSSCSVFIQQPYGTCVFDTSESATYTYDCWEDAPSLKQETYLKVEYFNGYSCDGDPFEYQQYELNACEGQLKYDCNSDGNVDVYTCGGEKQSTEASGQCFRVFGEPTSFKFTCELGNSAASLSFQIGLLASLMLICFLM
mmetsp:Transcript_20553/g.28838  ORF Transcript_20553/g.28838 Transcript_20553/m.28838 type:complete len:222 (+) Transcript_20553:1-666(+)